jgi:serine/threonine-protein kinase
MSGTRDAANHMESKKNSSFQPTRSEALPRSFGRLILLKHLARGGMGDVFLATARGIEGTERPCVVKIIRPDHASDESFLARFLDEARIQAQLQHPGVAQVLEATTADDGQPFVVVEHVEGRNLGEVRSRATSLGVGVAWPEAVAVAIALGDALAHVHERTDADGRPLSIVHRDLSPQNVMVGYGGDVKVIDFGTARGENRRSRTISGVVFAKPGYVAPEVANNTPGGAPADLYAFGVILWELLAGRRFLDGDAATHLAEVALGERRPGPLSELVGAPPTIDAIIARLTATEAGERYARAHEAVADLVMALKQASTLPNGDRSVRGRIASLMQRLYPAEPARSRAEFAELVALARREQPPRVSLPPSPSPPESDEPDLLPGTRYKLMRRIGEGGMGVVYEAVHIDLSRTVAIKLLAREHSASPVWVAQFRAEARAIAQLAHEHIVQLHDFGVSADGQPFYVMEWLDGESLESYLEREKGMDYREALEIGVKICRALEVAHRADIVHRDIKPENLFLVRGGGFKLLDFGIAQALTRAPARDPDASPEFRIVGTPEYLAPEQATGGDADRRSDLYSLGVVLYRLVTGELPHAGRSAVALLHAKTSKTVEPPRLRAPKRGLPLMVDRIITQALEQDPERRFQTATELRFALERALGEPARARRRRQRIGRALVAATVLGACTLTALAVAKPGVREHVVTLAARGSAFVRSIQERHDQSARAAVAVTANEASAEREAQKIRSLAEASREAPDAPAAHGESDELLGENEPAAAPADARDEDGSNGDTEAGVAEFGPPLPPDSEPEEALVAAPSNAPSAPSGHDVGSEVAQAIDMMSAGSKIKGFNALRRLGKKNPAAPSVLQAWSYAAVQMKAWGEAHRVAREWAKVDPSVDARLHLAWLERATGRGNPRTTVRKLADEHPDNPEVQKALATYGGGKVASR